MPHKAVPMFHVPDVRATMDWYATILGCKVINQNELDGEIDWGMLSFGHSELMLNAGGKPSTAHRREVDLYMYVENVDDLFERIKDRVRVVESPHDTFYRMHEFTIRDINGFWITFGQPLKG